MLYINQAQPQAAGRHTQVGHAEYEQILNAVFSHEEPTARDLKYSITLRFMTSRHAESEIVINTLRSGMPQATLYTVPGPSVWDVANDYVQKHGHVDVQAVAGLVRANKKTIQVSPDEISVWYSNMLKSVDESGEQLRQDLDTFNKTGSVTVVLDGTTYELQFQQSLTDITWQVMDDEVNDTRITGRSYVAKWMNEVRVYAVSHSTQ